MPFDFNAQTNQARFQFQQNQFHARNHEVARNMLRENTRESPRSNYRPASGSSSMDSVDGGCCLLSLIIVGSMIYNLMSDGPGGVALTVGLGVCCFCLCVFIGVRKHNQASKKVFADNSDNLSDSSDAAEPESPVTDKTGLVA